MFRFFRFLFLLLLLVALAGAAYYSVYPDISRLKRHNPDKTAFMEYREREWKSAGRKVRIRRKWVGFAHISPYLEKAVIIAEDDKFWFHQGFDMDAIEKALERDLKEGRFKFGGSTISQQLVKNLYLSPSKNPLRKLTEAVITWRMERTLSKRRILELYLNVAEWGDAIFGVEAASLHCYGKPSSLLSPEEAARLAAVLPNPRRYTVNGNSRYAQRRARLIYTIMLRRGIVVKDYEEASREPDRPLPPPEGEEPQPRQR
ncbi:MAG: monofunctional biosynthetic peptidoglycan transglycosylase [Syntrophorhabdales bacterium]